MNPEKQALAIWWRHKQFFLLQAVAVAIWALLAVSWFWLPDSKIWGLALAAVLALALLSGAFWLIGTALLFYRRAHAGDDVRLSSICRDGLRQTPALLADAARGLFRRPMYILDATILAAVGLLVPYALMGWRPQLRGLLIQTASLAVRLLLAYLVAVIAWLVLASLLAAAPARSTPTR